MGYRKTTRRIEVSLKNHKVYGQDTEHPVAYARGKNLAEYLRLMGYSEAEDADERAGIVQQLEEFADALVSWNLEGEDGTPVPCTRDGLFSIDNDLALALATEWMERLGGKVDDADPLPQSSPSGGPSLVESVPMEALSDPQPLSSVPA
ncbi:hypothetical protein [Streptomyces sp. NPDC088812]|uniref:hypothetical protein n=1 Tax=Streptomyces sp. NPDC088812 TaxID=3365905 RepID=UPI003816999B